MRGVGNPLLVLVVSVLPPFGPLFVKARRILQSPRLAYLFGGLAYGTVYGPNPALKGTPRVRGFATAPGSPLACVR